jgi:hypothetical protein
MRGKIDNQKHKGEKIAEDFSKSDGWELMAVHF